MSLFLLTVFGLLLGAGIKGKMEKAGLEPRFNWAVGREMWEVRFARPPVENSRLMFVDYVGTHTAQTFGRVWAWGAKSRWWPAGGVRRSARVAFALSIFCMECYTYYILHNDLREDIKST